MSLHRNAPGMEKNIVWFSNDSREKPILFHYRKKLMSTSGTWGASFVAVSWENGSLLSAPHWMVVLPMLKWQMPGQQLHTQGAGPPAKEINTQNIRYRTDELKRLQSTSWADPSNKRLIKLGRAGMSYFDIQLLVLKSDLQTVHFLLDSCMLTQLLSDLPLRQLRKWLKSLD